MKSLEGISDSNDLTFMAQETLKDWSKKSDPLNLSQLTSDPDKSPLPGKILPFNLNFS